MCIYIRKDLDYLDDGGDDNDNNQDDCDFADTLGETFGVSSIPLPALDLDDAIGAVDSSVDLDRTPLVSPLSPTPPFAPFLIFLVLLGSPPENRSFHYRVSIILRP